MSKSLAALVMAAVVAAAGAAHLFAQTVPPSTKEQVDKLVAVIKSDAPQKDKVDACRQLGVIGTKDAVPAIAALLADEKLSHMARYALEPLPDPSVDEAFRDALGKLKGRPLVGVIASIGVRRDAKAVPALVKLLADGDADVAQGAARALGSIGTSEAAKALEGALASVPETNQLALCEGLLRAAESLAAAGKTADAQAIYDRLLTLKEPHQVQTAALRGAILVRGKEGLALLRENLRNKDYLLFAAAVRTTYEIPGAEVTQALAAELPQLPPDNQVLVLQTLGYRGDAAALPAILAAAKTGPKPVRLAAIKAMSAIRAGAADVAALIKDADQEISQAAKECLASIPGKQADDIVLAMLTEGEPATRLLGLELVGRRRMTAAIPAIMKATEDTDASVRAAAIRTVGDLGGEKEFQTLLDRLMQARDAQEVGPLEQAVGALCSKADSRDAWTERLASMMSKATPPQKAALLRVLGAAGGQAALKAVRAAVGDSDKDVHGAAVRVLCSWKSPDVIPDLLAMARSGTSPTDKTLALRGYLGWAGNSSVPAQERLTMCRQAGDLVQRPDEKKLLLSALGSTGLAEALPLVMSHVDDAAVKNEACAAAVSIAEKVLKGPGANRAAQTLVEAMQKVSQAAGNADVAQRAKAAMEQARSKIRPR